MAPIPLTPMKFSSNLCKDKAANVENGGRMLHELAGDNITVYSAEELRELRHDRRASLNIRHSAVQNSIVRTETNAQFARAFNFTRFSSDDNSQSNGRPANSFVAAIRIPSRSASYHGGQVNGGHHNGGHHNGGHYNGSSMNNLRQSNRGTPHSVRFFVSFMLNKPYVRLRLRSLTRSFLFVRCLGRQYANGTAASHSVHIGLSLRGEVKLKEAENAWKPSFLDKVPKKDDDGSEELFKQVRLILNKLTAQNFAVLSEQFQNLRIDNNEKLIEVINLVFNKAVNEPNFSEQYGKLSKYLSQCSQRIDGSSSACFKRTLITKCQKEFEQNVANKNATEAALEPLMEKMKAFEKAGDANGVAEVKALIAEQESNLRRRLVSTIRFIGELYKTDMLTTNIMNVCISTLIREVATTTMASSNQGNEKLECLCKLLTTIGGKLEQMASKADKDKAQAVNVANYMNQLKRIAENKGRNFKPSTRIK